MLSKLIGYEFKATRRIYLPAFGIVLVLSLLSSITFGLTNQWNSVSTGSGPFTVILMSVYILALFAVCVLALAYTINRFYKNLLGDEGYLMFTLPARPSQLIWSKCIASTTWTVLAILVCMVSALLFFVIFTLTQGAVYRWITWTSFSYTMSDLFHSFGVNLFLIPLELIVVCILWVMNFCLHIYACLSLGSLANRHRLGMAFVAYLVFAVLSEILLTVGTSLADSFLPSYTINSWNDTMTLHIALIGYIVFTVIRMIINFAITNYILTRHLNLQ